jgi:hypothetical protein
MPTAKIDRFGNGGSALVWAGIAHDFRYRREFESPTITDKLENII